MRSWDIAVSIQTSSKPSNHCTEQNRLKKKQTKPYSVTASIITLVLQQLSKMALVSLGTHCFLSGWYREMLQWIQYSWFVFKTKCCCIQIPYSNHLQTKRSVFWQCKGSSLAEEGRVTKLTVISGASRRDSLKLLSGKKDLFKTIVAKLLRRRKQTYILEIECSFQMTLHVPVSWCISIRYASFLILGKENFSSLGFSLASISREISLSLEDVLTSAAAYNTVLWRGKLNPCKEGRDPRDLLFQLSRRGQFLMWWPFPEARFQLYIP